MIQTLARAKINITREMVQLLRAAEIEQGLSHVYVHHSSASLIVSKSRRTLDDNQVRRQETRPSERHAAFPVLAADTFGRARSTVKLLELKRAIRRK